MDYLLGCLKGTSFLHKIVIPKFILGAPIQYFCQFTRLMYYEGLLIGIAAFLCIGLFHPIVIKTEYYFGTRPWWIFLLVGIGCAVGALFIENTLISSIVGVFGFSSLWSIKELFEQEERVRKGWFPRNPNRK